MGCGTARRKTVGGASQTGLVGPDDRLDSHLGSGACASEAGVVVLDEVVCIVPGSWFTSKHGTCEGGALEPVSASGGCSLSTTPRRCQPCRRRRTARPRCGSERRRSSCRRRSLERCTSLPFSGHPTRTLCPWFPARLSPTAVHWAAISRPTAANAHASRHDTSTSGWSTAVARTVRLPSGAAERGP